MLPPAGVAGGRSASTSHPWPLVRRKLALCRVGAMPQPSFSSQVPEKPRGRATSQ